MIIFQILASISTICPILILAVLIWSAISETSILDGFHEKVYTVVAFLGLIGFIFSFYFIWV